MNLNSIHSYKKREKINKKVFSNQSDKIAQNNLQKSNRKYNNFVLKKTTDEEQIEKDNFKHKLQKNDKNNIRTSNNLNQNLKEKLKQKFADNTNIKEQKSDLKMFQLIKQKLTDNLKEQLNSFVLNNKFHTRNLNMNINIHYNSKDSKNSKSNQKTQQKTFKAKQAALQSSQRKKSKYELINFNQNNNRTIKQKIIQNHQTVFFPHNDFFRDNKQLYKNYESRKGQFNDQIQQEQYFEKLLNQKMSKQQFNENMETQQKLKTKMVRYQNHQKEKQRLNLAGRQTFPSFQQIYRPKFFQNNKKNELKLKQSRNFNQRQNLLQKVFQSNLKKNNLLQTQKIFNNKNNNKQINKRYKSLQLKGFTFKNNGLKRNFQNKIQSQSNNSKQLFYSIDNETNHQSKQKSWNFQNKISKLLETNPQFSNKISFAALSQNQRLKNYLTKKASIDKYQKKKPRRILTQQSSKDNKKYISKRNQKSCRKKVYQSIDLCSYHKDQNFTDSNNLNELNELNSLNRNNSQIQSRQKNKNRYLNKYCQQSSFKRKQVQSRKQSLDRNRKSDYQRIWKNEKISDKKNRRNLRYQRGNEKSEQQQQSLGESKDQNNIVYFKAQDREKTHTDNSKKYTDDSKNQNHNSNNYQDQQFYLRYQQRKRIYNKQQFDSNNIKQRESISIEQIVGQKIKWIRLQIMYSQLIQLNDLINLLQIRETISFSLTQLCQRLEYQDHQIKNHFLPALIQEMQQKLKKIFHAIRGSESFQYNQFKISQLIDTLQNQFQNIFFTHHQCIKPQIQIQNFIIFIYVINNSVYKINEGQKDHMPKHKIQTAYQQWIKCVNELLQIKVYQILYKNDFRNYLQIIEITYNLVNLYQLLKENDVKYRTHGENQFIRFLATTYLFFINICFDVSDNKKFKKENIEISVFLSQSVQILVKQNLICKSLINQIKQQKLSKKIDFQSKQIMHFLQMMKTGSSQGDQETNYQIMANCVSEKHIKSKALQSIGNQNKRRPKQSLYKMLNKIIILKFEKYHIMNQESCQQRQQISEKEQLNQKGVDKKQQADQKVISKKLQISENKITQNKVAHLVKEYRQKLLRIAANLSSMNSMIQSINYQKQGKQESNPWRLLEGDRHSISQRLNQYIDKFDQTDQLMQSLKSQAFKNLSSKLKLRLGNSSIYQCLYQNIQDFIQFSTQERFPQKLSSEQMQSLANDQLYQQILFTYYQFSLQAQNQGFNQIKQTHSSKLSKSNQLHNLKFFSSLITLEYLSNLTKFQKGKYILLQAYSLYFSFPQSYQSQMLIQENLSKLQKSYLYKLLSLLITIKIQSAHFYQAYHVIQQLQYYGVCLNQLQKYQSNQQASMLQKEGNLSKTKDRNIKENQALEGKSKQKSLDEKSEITIKKDVLERVNQGQQAKKENYIDDCEFGNLKKLKQSDAKLLYLYEREKQEIILSQIYLYELNVLKHFCTGVVLLMKRKLQQSVAYFVSTKLLLTNYSSFSQKRVSHIQNQLTFGNLCIVKSIVNIYLAFAYYCLNHLYQTQKALEEQMILLSPSFSTNSPIKSQSIESNGQISQQAESDNQRKKVESENQRKKVESDNQRKKQVKKQKQNQQRQENIFLINNQIKQEFANKAREISIVRYNLLICKGLIKIKQKSYLQAIQYLKDSLKIFNRPEPHAYLALANYRSFLQKQNEEKYGLLHQHDKQFQKSSILINNLLEKHCNPKHSSFSQEKNHEEIYIHLCCAVNLVTQMNNNFAAVIFYFRSLYYCWKGRWEMALIDIDEAIQKSEQNYPKYFYLRALILACSQNYKQAISEASVAISLDEKDHQSYLLRSKCCQIQGDQNQAFLDLQTYITLRPDDTQIHKFAGHLLFQNGAFEDAILAYEQGQSNLQQNQRDNESDFHVYLTRSKTYFLLGQFEKSAFDMKKAAEIKNQEPQYYFDYLMISFLNQLIKCFENSQQPNSRFQTNKHNYQQQIKNKNLSLQLNQKIKQKILQLQEIYSQRENNDIEERKQQSEENIGQKQKQINLDSRKVYGKIFKKVEYHLFKFLMLFCTQQYKAALTQIQSCVDQKQHYFKKQNECNKYNENNQEYQEQEIQKQLFISQMYYNMCLLHIKMKDNQKAKKCLLKCKIETNSKTYPAWKSLLIELSSACDKKKLKGKASIQQGQFGNVASMQIYSDKNKLSKYFPLYQFSIQRCINENLVEKDLNQQQKKRLKICIPYPKVQPPQISPRFDSRLLKKFNQDEIQKKPEAPWITNEKNSIKFTNQIKTFSRLDIDHSQNQSKQPKKAFLGGNRKDKKNSQNSHSQQDKSMSDSEQQFQQLVEYNMIKKRSSRFTQRKHEKNKSTIYSKNNRNKLQQQSSSQLDQNSKINYKNIQQFLKLNQSVELKLKKLIK